MSLRKLELRVVEDLQGDQAANVWKPLWDASASFGGEEKIVHTCSAFTRSWPGNDATWPTGE